MSCLAIIPARGGSKRIPRKNIKDFCGFPIIAYSIRAALSAGIFDEVMVSTDDAEIAAVAEEYGANVPFMRSALNANDFATTADVICEVLTEYGKLGKDFELTCCLYATAPFTTASMLTSAREKVVSSGYDSVMPLLEFGFPIQRAVAINSDQRVQMIQPEHISTRSQDLSTCYHDAGQFYFVKSECIMQERKLFTANTGAIIVSELDAHDIDTEQDWILAEMKYKLRAGENT